MKPSKVEALITMCKLFLSVTMIEGTACHLLENNNGVINGVQYKDKENGLTKVRNTC